MRFLPLVFVSLAPWICQAKRLPSPTVKPVVRNGIEYSYAIEPLKSTCPEKKNGCGERVFLVSKAKKSGKENWKTELYQAVFDQDLEGDAQMIRPKSLKFKSKTALELTDEAKTRYLVSAKDGRLESPKAVKVYSGP